MKRILCISCALILLGAGCGDEYVTGVPSNPSKGGTGFIIPGSAVGVSASMIHDSDAFIHQSGSASAIKLPSDSTP